MQLYQKLASLVDAYTRCVAKDNTQWALNHGTAIRALVREHMPSGSGFDNGTTLDLNMSSGEVLRFSTSFHHMNGQGVYDGWTEHDVTVRASLQHGVRITVSGRDRNLVKDYIGEAFHDALTREVGS